MTIASRLRAYMEIWHKGKERAVKQSQAAKDLDCTDRDIRQATVELMEQGFVICGSNAGIYVPKNAGEARQYLASLRKHALAELHHVSRVQKALAEIYGKELQEVLFA